MKILASFQVFEYNSNVQRELNTCSFCMQFVEQEEAAQVKEETSIVNIDLRSSCSRFQVQGLPIPRKK